MNQVGSTVFRKVLSHGLTSAATLGVTFGIAMNYVVSDDVVAAEVRGYNHLIKDKVDGDSYLDRYETYYGARLRLKPVVNQK